MTSSATVNKTDVHDFWNEGSCGEVYAQGTSDKEKFEAQAVARYALEPYLHGFAKFEEGTNKDVLEIGVGFGADHTEWAKSKPKSLTGVDLTERAIENTKRRLSEYNLSSQLELDDAEKLSFEDDSFDIVYSWGVLHHSPNTPKAIQEVHRVLRKDGTARIMVYYKYSLTGFMLWARYALLKGKPLTSLATIYSTYLESPGTKAYTVKEAKELFKNYTSVNMKVQLCLGDLLEGEVGQRHRGGLLSIAKKLWPRPLIKLLFPYFGLFLMIEAKK